MTGCILVVDDDAVIRSFLADGLIDAGYQVITAHDGAEALASVYKNRPDAVLLDLLMPVVDGWDFLRARSVHPAIAAVPVVVFSAGGRAGLQDAAALRANAVLPKPLDLEVVSAVLEFVLADVHKYHADAAGNKSAGRGPAAGTDSAGSAKAPRRRIGTCPICNVSLYADIDAALAVPARIRAIHAVRRAHVLSHSATEIAQVPLRTRLMQMPVGQRRILADWLYRELRHHWGDADRRGVHTIDETLSSVTLHRLWQDAIRCAYPSCPHGD